MTIPRILLPTVYDPREWRQPYSAASMFLGASVEADPALRGQVEIDLISLHSESTPEALAEAVAFRQPDIVGFGIYTWNESVITRALPLLRQRLPRVRIFLGGLSVLYGDAAFHLDYPDVDLFFRGDAERVFPEALKYLLTGHYEQLLSGEIELSGVSSHETFEKRVQDRAVVPMQQITSYYLPDSSGSSFFERKANDQWKCVWWEMSRGCVYTCAFCGFDAQELGFRHHAVDRLLSEFDIFLDRGVEELFITDAILGGKRNNAKKVLRGLADPSRRDHGMYIYGFVRPEMIDEEFAQLLKLANFGYVNVGLQTVNPVIPVEMRANDVTLIRKNLPWLSRYGVRYQTDLIAGFPGETYDGFVDSVKFLIEEARPTRFRVYHLTVLPGTSLEALVQRHGSEWLDYAADGQVTSSYSWQKPDLDQMLRFANLSVALYDYMQRRRWLGREDEYRSCEFFESVFEQSERERDAFDPLAWDQKAASLGRDDTSAVEIERLLRARDVDVALYDRVPLVEFEQRSHG